MMGTPTPSGGVPAILLRLPPHLMGWQLPPDWRWGDEGLTADFRHYQQIHDALGRSLSLVTAPNEDHAAWLDAEARSLAACDHPSVPTTYHYWTRNTQVARGPGYLRRWIAGETVRQRLARMGSEGIGYVLTLLRAAGSALAYLHDSRVIHGAVSMDDTWVSPTGRVWLIGWQWAVAREHIPVGIRPSPSFTMPAPEFGEQWEPTPLSDQWQLAAMCWGALVGELPPPHNIPPLQLLYPEVPAGIGIALDRALSPDPLKRFPSVGALLRAVDRVSGSRSVLITGAGPLADERGPTHDETEESRVRWATADDYDVLALLGRGSFGTVWRVRDLTLGREVALKVLHPSIAKDERVVTRFRREARLAAQLSHPAIVPIYDWDSRGDVSWYTMELAEGGSLAQHLARKGPRPLIEVAPQAHQILDALSAAHNIGVIHRDLKPENVLIDRWFRWRITDFGIANVTGEDLGSSGSGTPAFAAPEQLLGEPQSPAADLFAVGAIVWYALTGLPPFEGKDPKTILAQQLTGELETTLFHPAVGAWLLRALAPKVEDRFADAQDMKGAWLDAAEAAIAAEQDEGSWWSRLVRGLGARG